MQGEILETLPKRDVSRKAGKRPCGCWGTFPEDADALHRILPGDKVTVELTPYDLTRARIVSAPSKFITAGHGELREQK